MEYQKITSSSIRPLVELQIKHIVLRLFLGSDISSPDPHLVCTLIKYIHTEIAREKRAPFIGDVMVLIANLSRKWASREESRPVICKHFDNVALTFDMEYVQSEMRVDKPDELVLAYTQSMMCCLLFNSAPESIGMVGLGGGSMVKFCYRHLPKTRVFVSEINAEVVAMRKKFKIPDDDERLEIVCGDGAQFVKAAKESFNILLIDGFDRHGQPPQLCSNEFYDHCWSALAADGMLVVNLLGHHQSSLQLYIRRIEKKFSGGVVAIKSVNSANIIVFAWKGKRACLSRAQLARQIVKLTMLDHRIVNETAKRILSASKNASARR